MAEARSANEPTLTRRCVIMKVHDFTVEKYFNALQQNAAAVLILLPQNISGVPHETVKVKLTCCALKQDLMRFCNQLIKTLVLHLSPSW